MSDELRSINGLTPQIGRYDGVRPAREVDMDADGGDGSGDEYHPNEWKEHQEPATKCIRKSNRNDGDSGDETPSPLQQELDRLRSIGEQRPTDTRSLRGRRYYQGETTAYHRAVAAAEETVTDSAEQPPEDLPEDPLEPDE